MGVYQFRKILQRKLMVVGTVSLISINDNLNTANHKICGKGENKRNNLKPIAVFDKEASRLKELQGSYLRPHTHRSMGRARRHLTIKLKFLILLIMGQTQWTQG